MDTIFISKVEGISEFFYEKLDACFMEGSSNFVTDSIIRDFRICDINKVIEIFVEEKKQLDNKLKELQNENRS